MYATTRVINKSNSRHLNAYSIFIGGFYIYTIIIIILQKYTIIIRDIVNVPLQFHNFLRYTITYSFDVFFKIYGPKYLSSSSFSRPLFHRVVCRSISAMAAVLEKIQNQSFHGVRATHRYGRLVTSRPCRRGGDSRRSHQCWIYYVLVSAL